MPDHDYTSAGDDVDWRVPPPELETYARLDLSPGGPLVRSLSERLEHDHPIGREPVKLTSDLSAEPAGLTSDPDYPKIKRDADHARVAFDHAYRVQVTDELARLDAKCAEAVKLLEQQDKTQQSSPNYEHNRRLFAQLRTVDERVLAALRQYRTQLARSLPTVRYDYPDRNIVNPTRSEVITASGWATKDMAMKYHGATR